MEAVTRLTKEILKDFRRSKANTTGEMARCIRSCLTKVNRLGEEEEKLLTSIEKKGHGKLDIKTFLEEASVISRTRMAAEIESVDLLCALAKETKVENNSLYKYILRETNRPAVSMIEIPGNMCAQSLEEPIVGRANEVSQLAACLARKNRIPFIIGKPGVGKTSVMMGLARLLSFNAIPQLTGTILLDTSQYLPPPVEVAPGQVQMVQAGGPQFHQFLSNMDNTSVVAVFDGAGRHHAQQIAMMSRNFRILVTCDDSDYKAIIGVSKELQKRAVLIRVSEPSTEETKEILRMKARKFEYDFNCRIAEEVMDYTVDVSTKFNCEASQPEKSITLMEVTCARKRIQLSKSSDYLNVDIGKAIRDRDINLLKKLAEASGNQAAAKMIMIGKKVDITRREVSESLRLVADISKNIPLDAITADSVKLLKMLEPYVREKVYGQDEAVEKVCKAIRRKSLNLSEPNRPASFLFVGPTGVGKTYLAENIADLMFGSRKALHRFDMSEYQDRHTASKLIGAPPGFVGYEKGGELTNRVHSRPYCVLLLDEIEKAHRDVLDVLLQVLDNGRLTDSKGREIDFKHTIVIMTSNLGTMGSIKTGIGFAKKENETRKARVSEDVKGHLRPEFINRLNGIVQFNALDEKPLRRILEYGLNHLGEFSSYNIKIGNGVVDHMMDKIKSNEKVKTYGAREVKRMIDNDVADVIASTIIDRVLPAGTNIVLSAKDGKLIVEKQQEDTKDDEEVISITQDTTEE